MDKTKKIICTFLCVVCLLGFVPAINAQAASDTSVTEAFSDSMEAAKEAYVNSVKEAQEATWKEYNDALEESRAQLNEKMEEIEQRRQQLIAEYKKRRNEVIRFIYNSLNSWVDEMNALLDSLDVDKQYRFSRYTVVLPDD